MRMRVCPRDAVRTPPQTHGNASGAADLTLETHGSVLTYSTHLVLDGALQVGRAELDAERHGSRGLVDLQLLGPKAPIVKDLWRWRWCL